MNERIARSIALHDQAACVFERWAQTVDKEKEAREAKTSAPLWTMARQHQSIAIELRKDHT